MTRPRFRSNGRSFFRFGLLKSGSITGRAERKDHPVPDQLAHNVIQTIAKMLAKASVPTAQELWQPVLKLGALAITRLNILFPAGSLKRRALTRSSLSPAGGR
jgi:hypothetical protein